MTSWSRNWRRCQGFTLVELVAVMIIITLLAGAVTIAITKRIEHGRRARTVQDIATLETALDLYAADNGSSPSTEQGLQALIVKPNTPPVPINWNGPYIKKKTIPKDPWGNEYIYQNPGQYNPDGYDLASFGADGKPGGTSDADKDITNYEE